MMMLAWLAASTVTVAPSPTPVSLLSGFLGAGKTTCLSHLVSNSDGMRIGLVVNDVAALNIDAGLVSDAAGDDGVIRLQNGCACCDIAGELTESLRKLGASGEYDHILVELSGVAEPDVAKANLRLALAKDADMSVKLSRVVTLVDSATFLTYFNMETQMGQVDDLREAHSHDDGEPHTFACADTRAVAQLLINQVDAADVIVVNKLDKITDDTRQLLEGLLGALNPKASMTATRFGKLPNELVMPSADEASGGSAPTAAAEDAAAEEEQQQEQEQDEEQEEEQEIGRVADPSKFGISSFVYSSRRPFDAKRLTQLISGWPKDAATPLQDVSLELGLDVKVKATAEEEAAANAEANAKALAANPDQPPLRFSIGERVECNCGYWAAGSVVGLWYIEEGWDFAVPYQVQLDSGDLIYAPQDIEEVVRRGAAPPDAPAHPFRGVLRSKGWCWLNVNPTAAGFWSHAGRSLELTTAGNWWVTKSDAGLRRELGDGLRYEEAKASVAAMNSEFGDGRQDLVFIGVGMDEAAIREALDQCLLANKEEFLAFKQAWQKDLALAQLAEGY